jgi:hypothetical protein
MAMKLESDHDLASAVPQPTSRYFDTRRAGDLKHPANWIRAAAVSPKEHVPLARSYLAYPINFILISPDGEVRDGNLRLTGIIADTGPDTLVPVCVTEEEITESVSLQIMLETAEHTKALSPFQKYVGFSKWLELTGGTARELATKMHISEGMVSIILSLSKCIPPVHEAAKAGKIAAGDWHAISRNEAQNQQITLDLMLGGVKRSELPGKKSKPKGPEAVRIPTLKCPLPTGHLVTIKGDASLEEAVDVLKDAIRAIKEAIGKNYTAKTFQAAAKDIAAAG